MSRNRGTGNLFAEGRCWPHLRHPLGQICESNRLAGVGGGTPGSQSLEQTACSVAFLEQVLLDKRLFAMNKLALGH